MNELDILQDHFEPALLAELKQYGNIMTIEHGQHIINAGQTLHKMPILLEGSIKVSRIDDDGNELLLYYLEAGETCAMTITCCIQKQASEIQAIAEGQVKLLVIPLDQTEIWMSKYASWKAFIMQNIKNRFDELLKTIDQIAFRNLDDRLVHFLREQSKMRGSTLINLSHQEIADNLASSRVVISRLLKKLESDKKLLLYRNQIKLLQNF